MGVSLARAGLRQRLLDFYAQREGQAITRAEWLEFFAQQQGGVGEGGLDERLREQEVRLRHHGCPVEEGWAERREFSRLREHRAVLLQGKNFSFILIIYIFLLFYSFTLFLFLIIYTFLLF